MMFSLLTKFYGTIVQKYCCACFVNLLGNFDVLLNVHLSIFISVFNQIDAQNLFHNKLYFMSVHVSSTYAHYQGIKIALNRL